MCKISAVIIFAFGFLILSTGLAQAQDDEQKSLAPIADLSKWTCPKKADKEHWHVNKQGHLITDVEKVSIACELEFPEAVEIQLRITWKNKLAFSLGLGVSERKIDYEYVPRIESWEDSLVLNGYEDFGIIYDQIDLENKEIELRIEWDRTENVFTIFEPGPNGRKILTQRFDQVEARRAVPGLTIVNRNGDLTIEKLLIRERKIDH